MYRVAIIVNENETLHSAYANTESILKKRLIKFIQLRLIKYIHLRFLISLIFILCLKKEIAIYLLLIVFL